MGKVSVVRNGPLKLIYIKEGRQVADGGEIWMVVANILKKHPSRTADKGWSSSLLVGQ
jgi:hypothetical protein